MHKRIHSKTAEGLVAAWLECGQDGAGEVARVGYFSDSSIRFIECLLYWLLWESPVSMNTYLLFSLRKKVVDVCGNQ